MTIEKNGIVYFVKENLKSWTLSKKIGSVSVSYNVSKTDFPDFEALKAYVAENSVF